MFAKFALLHCVICLIICLFDFILWLFAQIILLVAIIYFSNAQKYLFKNTTFKILHKGAK